MRKALLNFLFIIDGKNLFDYVGILLQFNCKFATCL